MSNKAVRHRKATTNDINQYIIPRGDMIIDTTKPTVVIGDGATTGGIPLAQQSHGHSNATTNTAGFMSSTDKTKLDAIADSGAITAIESDAVAVAPARATLNFDTDFALVDNVGNESTDVSVSASFRQEMLDQMLLLTIALG